MTEFEAVLQECLQDLEQGRANIEECLKRYPVHAGQLEPVLLASVYLQQGQGARLSDGFKTRVRSKLLGELYAHPRRNVRPGFTFARLAAGLAVVVLALLAAGTAYAQTALPGDAFYIWKLASENGWRTISPDPVRTDLTIARRRLEELIAVRQDPALYPQALTAYLEMTERLKTEMNAGNEAQISETLQIQKEELDRAGVILPSTEPTLPPPSFEPTVAPLVTPPVLVIPPVTSTRLPDVVPTVQTPSEILPTQDVLPKIVPTLEIPPPLR